MPTAQFDHTAVLFGSGTIRRTRRYKDIDLGEDLERFENYGI